MVLESSIFGGLGVVGCDFDSVVTVESIIARERCGIWFFGWLEEAIYEDGCSIHGATARAGDRDNAWRSLARGSRC